MKYKERQHYHIRGLQRCPRCGARAFLMVEYNRHICYPNVSDYETWGDLYTIECDEYCERVRARTKEDAIKYWNELK